MTDKQEKQVATRGQRRKIRNMLDGDQISFELAQAIIEGDVRIVTEDEKRLVFWEERFPGKGAAMMELLRPFYDWKPELKPALPDLEKRAMQAIFWTRVKGVRAISLIQIPEESSALGDSLDDNWKELLEEDDMYKLTVSISKLCDDVLRDSSISDFKREIFLVPLVHACSCTIAGRCIGFAIFQDLVDIWRAGNFPIEIDEEGYLLVLVADPPTTASR